MNSLMKKTNGSAPATAFGGVVDKIFQDNLSRFFDDNFWGFNQAGLATNVPVNIRETDKSFELQLVAPGLRKEDFKINISGDLLTVGFEQKETTNQENKEEGWLRKEYKLQSFTRTFNINDTIDANAITARYSDGMLYLSLPKKEGAQRLTRTIEIA